MGRGPTLYELDEALKEAIENHVDKETGEISEDGLRALDAVEMALDEKALRVARYILGLGIEAEGLKAQAQAIEKHATGIRRRMRAKTNEADRMKEYLSDHLEDGKTLSDDFVRISWGTASGLNVLTKPENLPEWAQTVALPSANKKALGDALRDESDEGKEKKAEAKKHAELTKRRYVKVS